MLDSPSRKEYQDLWGLLYQNRAVSAVKSPTLQTASSIFMPLQDSKREGLHAYAASIPGFDRENGSQGVPW